MKKIKKMKIDIKQLAKIEKEYRYDNPISCNSLQTMVDIILSYNNTGADATFPPNVLVAMNTLKELKILKDENSVQQLNS